MTKPLKFASPVEVAPGATITVCVIPTAPFVGQTFRCSDDVAKAFQVLSIKVGPFEQLANSVEEGGDPVPFFSLRGARLSLETVRPPEAITLVVHNIGREPLRFTCELEPPS